MGDFEIFYNLNMNADVDGEVIIFRAFRPLNNYYIEIQKDGYENLINFPVPVSKDVKSRVDFFIMPDI